MTAAVAAILLASCAAEEPAVNTGGADGLVRLSVSVGGGSSRSNPIGTPEQQRTFNTGDTISVSDGTTIAKYVYNGTDWVGHNNRYLNWPEAWPANFAAKHGYSQGSEELHHDFYKWWVPGNQTTFKDLSNADYMLGEARYDAMPADGRIQLVMKRKTARVIVRIKSFNNEFDGTNPRVTKVEMTSGAFIPGTGGGMYIRSYQQGDGGVGTTYTALISPNTMDDVRVTVVDDTGEQIIWATTNVPCEEGKSYTVDLVVGKHQAIVGGVSVSDWTDGGVLDDAHLDEWVGYTIKDDTYYIYNEKGLYNFAKDVNSGNQQARNVVLEDDIDISCYDNWTPIGTNENSHVFAGTFDGKGHTVSGMVIDTISGTYANIGLFGRAVGTITNVKVSGSITVRRAQHSYIGGIIGYTAGNSTVTACHSNVTITLYGEGVTECGVGGITGTLLTTRNDSKIAGCYNTGKIECLNEQENDQNNISGIIGETRTGGFGGYAYITGCYNRADIIHSRGNAVTTNTYGDAPKIIDCFFEKVTTDIASTYGAGDVADTDWETAMNTMNSAIRSYGYKYTLGDTPEVPLVITNR